MSPHIDGVEKLEPAYGSHQQRICGTMTVPLGAVFLGQPGAADALGIADPGAHGAGG